ncbi:MAG: hypothetical protein BWY67_00881 [Bacteroidetes bacterium ADurb.Bin397]|nr:MAG: hypothetical protein BWY67_00881 [Bacteroidetes bacterium ADurb.Bin397]
MKLKIDDNNYQTYKKVFEILCQHLLKDLEVTIPADAHPIAVLNSWEVKSKSLAKRGLKSGLMDLLGNIKEIPHDISAAINSDLEKNNLPSINKLTGIIKDSIYKVLQTKKINNINQYYIIKELLDDTVSDITETERRDLSKFLGEFEAKATNH